MNRVVSVPSTIPPGTSTDATTSCTGRRGSGSARAGIDGHTPGDGGGSGGSVTGGVVVVVGAAVVVVDDAGPSRRRGGGVLGDGRVLAAPARRQRGDGDDGDGAAHDPHRRSHRSRRVRA